MEHDMCACVNVPASLRVCMCVVSEPSVIFTITTTITPMPKYGYVFQELYAYSIAFVIVFAACLC